MGVSVKQNPDGSINKYKSRLVARGFSQVPGVDYFETFAPVMHLTSLRFLIAFANARGMTLQHMDVKTAFLNGKLHEEIFMRQPEGFVEKGKERMVCKLQKSLYGLKQSSRCWNTVLNAFLEKQGFTKSPADQCVYWRERRQDGERCLTVVGVYVDDLVIGSDTAGDLQQVKECLSKRFEMSELGPLAFILGIQVKRHHGKTFICQAKYAREILQKYGMQDCKPASTPREVGEQLPKRNTQEDPIEQTKYQSLIGSLMYLMLATRPDIANAVNSVAQHASNPGQEHWTAAKRVLRYIKGTVDFGIMYGKKQAKTQLIGYTDADWAGDKNDRKSTSGYAFTYGGGPVSWSAKKQGSVALSTAETEYIATGHAVQGVIWLRELMGTSDRHVEPTILYADNQSAIALTKNAGAAFTHKTYRYSCAFCTRCADERRR